MTVLTSEQGTEGDPSPPSPSTAPPPPTHTTTCPGSREQAGHPPVQVLQLPAVPAGSGGRLPIPRGAFGPPPPRPRAFLFPGLSLETDPSQTRSDWQTGPGLGPTRKPVRVWVGLSPAWKPNPAGIRLGAAGGDLGMAPRGEVRLGPT